MRINLGAKTTEVANKITLAQNNEVVRPSKSITEPHKRCPKGTVITNVKL